MTAPQTILCVLTFTIGAPIAALIGYITVIGHLPRRKTR